MSIYLDYNATSPVLPSVIDAMMDVYSNHFGNASSRTHSYGQDARKLVEEARTKVARALAIDNSEVVFTSGSTESNNLAIQGLAAYGLKNGKTHLVTTVIEHSSVLEPMKALERQGFKIDYVPVNTSGRIDAKELLEYVTDQTLMVSMMHANNETGIIQPVEEIGETLANRDVYFHIDASQTLGKLILPLQNLKYDLLSCTAHKVYGPQGIGVLVTRQKRYRRPPLQPILFGGGHEKGLRPGTLPVALIVGFGVAVDACIWQHESWEQNYQGIRRSILDQISQVTHVINGDQDHCLDNCINVSFPGIDSEALMMAVKESLALSNGSACTSSEYKPSHVLQAMRCDSDSAIRFSWGPHTKGVNLEPLITFIEQTSL